MSVIVPVKVVLKNYRQNESITWKFINTLSPELFSGVSAGPEDKYDPGHITNHFLWFSEVNLNMSMYIWSVTNDHIYIYIYIYDIRPSSLCFTQQTISRINMWSLFQHIYTLFSLRFENVICRMKNVYICWFENACFFSYSSNIVSSFSLTSENAATYHKLVCFEETTSFSCCLWHERTITQGVW